MKCFVAVLGLLALVKANPGVELATYSYANPAGVTFRGVGFNPGFSLGPAQPVANHQYTGAPYAPQYAAAPVAQAHVPVAQPSYTYAAAHAPAVAVTQKVGYAHHQVPVQVQGVADVPVTKLAYTQGVTQKLVDVAQPAVTNRRVKVRRPALRKEFYDIEHRVIVRPAGSATLELSQPIGKEQSGPSVLTPTKYQQIAPVVRYGTTRQIVDGPEVSQLAQIRANLARGAAPPQQPIPAPQPQRQTQAPQPDQSLFRQAPQQGPQQQQQQPQQPPAEFFRSAPSAPQQQPQQSPEFFRSAPSAPQQQPQQSPEFFRSAPSAQQQQPQQAPQFEFRQAGQPQPQQGPQFEFRQASQPQPQQGPQQEPQQAQFRSAPQQQPQSQAAPAPRLRPLQLRPQQGAQFRSNDAEIIDAGFQQQQQQQPSPQQPQPIAPPQPQPQRGLAPRLAIPEMPVEIQARLLELLSAKGGTVTEFLNENGQSTNSASVLQVADALQDVNLQGGERITTRRIVVTRPIETIQEIDIQEPATKIHRQAIDVPTLFKTPVQGVARVPVSYPGVKNVATPVLQTSLHHPVQYSAGPAYATGHYASAAPAYAAGQYAAASPAYAAGQYAAASPAYAY